MEKIVAQTEFGITSSLPPLSSVWNKKQALVKILIIPLKSKQSKLRMFCRLIHKGLPESSPQQPRKDSKGTSLGNKMWVIFSLYAFVCQIFHPLVYKKYAQ